MGETKREARTKRDLIVEAWERLDCESVGAKELEEIGKIVRQRLCEGAIDSPASVARTLADEGAVLRHPEVIEYDANWRQGELSQPWLDGMEFRGLKAAADSIRELERVRQALVQTGDRSGLRRLREAVQAVRKDLALNAVSKVVDEKVRGEAREIAQWLKLWLDSPELFADWLELRHRAPEFRQRFGRVL